MLCLNFYSILGIFKFLFIFFPPPPPGMTQEINIDNFQMRPQGTQSAQTFLEKKYVSPELMVALYA